ncbi:DHA2 family efflux MFS transporter permease subunit [Methylobacterium gregans]|uniref:Colistin resistance protein EmrB n=1 Tax=Methylobacterium gregans TaxID=374424 RepID=A0AA37HMV4_9HYPH|nr:DHA2 family efflux MFS transporter permease subunit [Methylobacterium gregans]MDQ0520794.1 DHA2 family multidrug resistance protein [Methylobacterium gregans]GJD78311.1 Colistin resistance protein EmrB [Methylobacterium gregans]GLS53258.1 MFS transporter [Methylobacterium gregans]
MAATAAAGSVPADPPLDRRRMVAFVCMVFGMFMAILDIQIVSASLNEIQAGLSASGDEIPWVQTSYLIAEVISIPLSGTLSRVLSTRWMFSISAGGFTLMSLMCATSSSIGEMIVWRAAQGFIGGGMIPTVFASAFTIFPPSKRTIVSPMIGLVATLAPTIGPTVGGYLTDLFSWHWLFLINIVPGIFVTVSTWFLVDFDRPNLDLLKSFDWAGLAFMAGFLGCLEYVLEEGPNHDWLQDEAVFVCALVCTVSGLLFFWRVFTARQPIVDLRAFSDRNFAGGCVFSFVMGIGLYGLTYLYPVYLARVRGYSALQIGETMFVSGLCMFATAPIAGKLSAKLDPRVMMAMGFSGFAVGTWIVTGLTKDWDFWELLLPQVLRGCSLMLCMIPINNIALGTLPPERMKNASGLFNLTRNLGGAVGLALINTVLNARWDLHLARLHERFTWANTAALERLDAMRRQFEVLGGDANGMALKAITNTVRIQGLVMSFEDVFLVLTVLFLAMACGTPLIRRPRGAAPAGAGH